MYKRRRSFRSLSFFNQWERSFSSFWLKLLCGQTLLPIVAETGISVSFYTVDFLRKQNVTQNLRNPSSGGLKAELQTGTIDYLAFTWMVRKSKVLIFLLKSNNKQSKSKTKRTISKFYFFLLMFGQSERLCYFWEIDVQHIYLFIYFVSINKQNRSQLIQVLLLVCSGLFKTA